MLHLHGPSQRRRPGSGSFCGVKARETEDPPRGAWLTNPRGARHGGGPQTAAAAWTPEPSQPASRRSRALVVRRPAHREKQPPDGGTAASLGRGTTEVSTPRRGAAEP